MDNKGKGILDGWTLERLLEGYIEALNSTYGIEGQIPDVSVINKIGEVYEKNLPPIPFIKPVTLEEEIKYNCFRIVKLSNSIPPLNVRECSYHPNHPVQCAINRCNFHGEQIFYAAEHPMTAIHESKLKSGEYYIIGAWQMLMKGMQCIMVHADCSTSKNMGTIFFRKFMEEQRPNFTKEQFPIFKHWYNIMSLLFLSNNKLISSYISHRLLRSQENTVIIYPAVEFYKLSPNIAIPTKIVDERLRLKEVYLCRADYVEYQKTAYTTFFKGTINGHGIQWTTDFDKDNMFHDYVEKW